MGLEGCFLYAFCVNDYKAADMIGNRKGFSLVELMITMVVFVFVIAAASQIFTGLLTQFKQQSKIGETDIEGAVGLDMLRYDLAQAGYGLPWNPSAAACGGSCNPCDWTCMPNYTEAAADAASPIADPASFNDAGVRAPRAITSGCSGFNNSCGASNGQSYLVIKSAVAATNYAAGKWTNLKSGDVKTIWSPNTQNVNIANDGTTNDNVRVIVLALGHGATTRETLVANGTTWYTTYSNTSGFAPTDAAETRVIYGVNPDIALRMPFNRTDYFISRPADIPARCAPNTGILYKTTVKQADGTLLRLPLLDCVAYMHVDYMLDRDVDGAVDKISDDIMTDIQADAGDCPDGNAACLIRNEIKEVRVYIIAQEGQRDAAYDFSNGGTRKDFSFTEALGSQSRTLHVPGVTGGGANLSTLIGDPEYKYYRWKLYTLVVQPNNLR
jgi:prepilin-type N-terminal cleavage/methylation domain-containing protein